MNNVFPCNLKWRIKAPITQRNSPFYGDIPSSTTVVVGFSSIGRSNITKLAFKLSQQLATLQHEEIFWASWDWKFAPKVLFKLNDDGPMSFETKQVFYCILCHSTILGVHFLGLKNWGRKGLISTMKMKLQPWKNIVKLNILTF